jgi:putative transposase
VRRTFKYRLFPNRAQAFLLGAQVDEACRLYNAALDERRSAWRMQRVSIRYLDQANQLKAIRAAGNVGVPNFSACQDVLRRVDKTFAAFLRRVKAGEKRPGYPRFRSRSRYDSLTWPSWGDGCALRPSERLYLQGVGDLKLKWHRPLPTDAQIKTVTAKREAGRWYACFSVELPEPEPLPTCNRAVGIDVGLTTFAVLSDGREIANPRHFRLAERRLRLAQRKLARRKGRSRRRLKARQEVARVHIHVANQRRDFHHKGAGVVVRGYGLIAVEDLNIKGLAGSLLAKSVHDAGWRQFLSILDCKAEEAGRTVVRVNPAGTTRDCSACGKHVPKTLSQRWHSCACGLSIGRDLNAALNVLKLAQGLGWSRQAPTVGAAHCRCLRSRLLQLAESSPPLHMLGPPRIRVGDPSSCRRARPRSHLTTATLCA